MLYLDHYIFTHLCWVLSYEGIGLVLCTCFLLQNVVIQEVKNG